MIEHGRRFMTFATLLLGLAASSTAEGVRLRPEGTVLVDAKGDPIASPQGVAFDGGSLMVVADTGNRRLVIYNVADEQLTAMAEARPVQLPYPVHVRIDSSGDILALDGRTQRIVRVTSTGDFKGFVDFDTGQARSATVIRSFDLDAEDNLYVLDVAGERVWVVDRAGRVTRQIAFAPDAGFVSDITVDELGIVYAVDSIRLQIYAARPGDESLAPIGGTLEGTVTFPTGIAADSGGYLYVVDRHGGVIVVFDQKGKFQARQAGKGWNQGFLRYPSNLDVSGDRLLVADQANSRIQIFSIVR